MVTWEKGKKNSDCIYAKERKIEGMNEERHYTSRAEKDMMLVKKKEKMYIQERKKKKEIYQKKPKMTEVSIKLEMITRYD